MTRSYVNDLYLNTGAYAHLRMLTSEDVQDRVHAGLLMLEFRSFTIKASIGRTIRTDLGRKELHG